MDQRKQWATEMDAAWSAGWEGWVYQPPAGRTESSRWAQYHRKAYRHGVDSRRQYESMYMAKRRESARAWVGAV
jgi:hypothetical protein